MSTHFYAEVFRFVFSFSIATGAVITNLSSGKRIFRLLSARADGLEMAEIRADAVDFFAEILLALTA